MIKTGLKSFDISSFNFEIEFNKRVAPITKKIDTLNKNNEKKSLVSHKDFLSKEKKSKRKLNELSEKALLRNQRIAKATENKLKKYYGVAETLDQELVLFKEELKQSNILINQELDERITAYKAQEKEDLKNIELKFAESIASYNDKLALFNVNYEGNVKSHNEQLSTYKDLVQSQFDKIEELKKSFDEELENDLKEIKEFASNVNNELNTRRKTVTKEMNASTTKIRHDANLRMTKLKTTVDELKDRTTTKYDTIISDLMKNISKIGNDFSARKVLIEKDLEVNLEVLNDSINPEKRKTTKTQVKIARTKMNLYEMRATTTIKYEESICDEQVRLLNDSLEQMNVCKKQELLNLDKLEIFLLEDQMQLKETGDYFKNLNLDLQKELANVEKSNTEFLLTHTKLRNDYLKKYNSIYNEFKLLYLESNKVKLEEIGDIDLEVDEINKFIDTSETLKEIQVNKIRESLEKTDERERYQVTYAKLDHERITANSDYHRDLEFEELKYQLEKTENDKAITDIKAKEIFDIEIEKAKLKHQKAIETDKLRLNSIRLERSLLKSNFETEIGFLGFRKELAEIDVDYEMTLYTDEIQTKIDNIHIEKDYKVDIVNQSLIENTLKKQDEINNIHSLIENNNNRIDIEISKEKNTLEKFKRDLLYECEEHTKLIDKALRRELRGPKRNLERANEVIDERLSRFDRTRSIFESFINDMIQNVDDEALTNDQRTEIVKTDTLLLERSREFISKTYRYLYEAVDFMNNLDQRTLKNRIATTTEDSKIRKLKRQLSKSQFEFEKQISNLDSARKSHTNSIADDIYDGVEQITNFVFVDKPLLDITKELYTNVYTELVSLQTNVADEVRELYRVLTKSDEEIIQHAEENAITSKLMLDEEREEKIIPKVEAMEQFIITKNDEKELFKSEKKLRVHQLNEEITMLKSDAARNVEIIKDELNMVLTPLTEQLGRVETVKSEKTDRKIASIEFQINDLNAQMKESLEKLKVKENDSKKLLDYELKIYNIAYETSESRFNDKTLTTESSYLNLLKSVEKKKSNAYAAHEKSLFETNKVVRDLTRNYEHNIFAVKPKLEESIGDAQKVIDYELSEKQKRLEFLTNEKNKIITLLEQNQSMSFGECYMKLMDNFNFYFDKLKLIRNDYHKSSRTFDDIIDKNSTDFAQALFELSKSKHELTLSKLIEINNEMIGEGDSNGKSI